MQHYTEWDSDVTHVGSPCHQRPVRTCSFLKGRKFPGTVRMTRAGDENPAEVDAKPASNQASAGTGVEVAASYVEDRQKHSLAGEPSTSEEVKAWLTDHHGRLS